MNVKSFAKLIMLAAKKIDETSVVLLYQMLIIENSKKFINCEAALRDILQIEELNILKSLKDLVYI